MISLEILTVIVLACQIGAPGTGSTMSWGIRESLQLTQKAQRDCQRKLIKCVRSKDKYTADCLESE